MTKQAAEGSSGGVGAISLQLRMNCTHRRMSGAYMGSIPSFKLMPSKVTNAQTQSTFITLTPTVETRAGHGETAAFFAQIIWAVKTALQTKHSSFSCSRSFLHKTENICKLRNSVLHMAMCCAWLIFLSQKSSQSP